ncbi:MULTISPECIES: SRPBCC family protein [Amycolatopsis]|uniref:SRPBCC family protein n=1 Tax=Amycolatopsis TaxID=1813 RepID=UPI000F77D371|nr:SRPBCC domain-containing protein [Amycolatopsis sp. WAC 04197]RSN46325.1 ATPase [Amycolatopsis sp. WAC 04197]
MSFTTSFTVDRTPQQVYDAFTDVRRWWSEEIEYTGDEFEYHYEEVHRCRIRITESVPGRKVSWLVLENHFDFTRDETEWVGTTITFEIEEKDGKTEARFTHHGLVPEYECFDVCHKAWTFYVGTSLRDLITTGEGQPNRQSVLPAELAR